MYYSLLLIKLSKAYLSMQIAFTFSRLQLVLSRWRLRNCANVNNKSALNTINLYCGTVRGEWDSHSCANSVNKMDRECNAEAVYKCADKNKGQKRQLRRKCVQTDAYIQKTIHTHLWLATQKIAHTYAHVFIRTYICANINKYVCMLRSVYIKMFVCLCILAYVLEINSLIEPGELRHWIFWN